MTKPYLNGLLSEPDDRGADEQKDALIYELYELTEEEIKIVEGIHNRYWTRDHTLGSFTTN